MMKTATLLLLLASACAVSPMVRPVHETRSRFAELHQCEDVEVRSLDPAYLDEPLGRFEYYLASGCGRQQAFQCAPYGQDGECVAFLPYQVPTDGPTATLKVRVRYGTAPLGAREQLDLDGAALVRRGGLTSDAFAFPITANRRHELRLLSQPIRRTWQQFTRNERRSDGIWQVTGVEAVDVLSAGCDGALGFDARPGATYRVQLDLSQPGTCPIVCAEETPYGLVPCEGWHPG